MRRLGTAAAKDELTSSTLVVVMMTMLWTSERVEEAVNRMLLSQPGNWVACVARRLHPHACLHAYIHTTAEQRIVVAPMLIITQAPCRLQMQITPLPPAPALLFAGYVMSALLSLKLSL